MLVMSVLVYLACQYRIYGFVSQAIAFEGAVRPKDEKPTRRPPALIRPSELGVLFGVCAALSFIGQLVWWLANGVEVVPAEDFPLRWAEPDADWPNQRATGRNEHGHDAVRRSGRVPVLRHASSRVSCSGTGGCA